METVECYFFTTQTKLKDMRNHVGRPVECYFCTTQTKLKDMRNHVGRHILCVFRDVGSIVTKERHADRCKPLWLVWKRGMQSAVVKQQ